MNEIDYDTEFLEDGVRIELISIGMVRDYGVECYGEQYYAINSDPDLMTRVVQHEWLAANVVPSLPVTLICGDADFRASQGAPDGWRWNTAHPDYAAVKHRDQIAAEVRDFILAEPNPQLWAWYGAYDHVALCQLWGRMIDLPKGVPMWTNDLKQEAVRLGNPLLPSMPGVTEHNALGDAREVRYRRQWLREYAATPVRPDTE